ncbi:MAG: transketolase [Clostridia bacterium]|nr:transketolase [Clostridia bacterium]
MALTKQEWLDLEKKAHELRHLALQTTVWAGSGHLGGGMSVMDLLTVLYYKYLNIKVEEPKWEDRDRFILSKGHAAIAYAPVLCDKGFNDPEMLKTFNLSHSKMGMHLDSNKVVGVDASTGSLGHGASIAAGTALAARILGKDYLTYMVTGDGELGEGSNWEGFMTMNHYNLSNCIVFIDRNHCMIDGNTEDVMKLEPLKDKMIAFGFETICVDGQNIKELCDAIDVAIERAKTPCNPTCILMDTVKGAGLTSVAGDYHCHYMAIDDPTFEKHKAELDAYYAERVARVEKEAK